jgi:hypothetical protein
MADVDLNAEKVDICKRIVRLFATIQSILAEAGVSNCAVPTDELLHRASYRRVANVLETLTHFCNGEAVEIFMAARALNPPEYWKTVEGDEMMSTAKDVRIYNGARRLVRQTWAEMACCNFFKPVKRKKEKVDEGPQNV